MRHKELVLGTVQLGMAYGRRDCPTEQQAKALLDETHAAKIDCFDTAPTYGLAEERLGRWIHGNGLRTRLISKLPAGAVEGAADPTGAIVHCLEGSLERLGVDRLNGYLVHRPADLHRPGVADALEAVSGHFFFRMGGYSRRLAVIPR